MATTTWDIESVVREVLRRLRDGASEAPGGPSAATNAAAPRARHEAPGELAVADRVVSLAAVDGRLAGIRRLVTRPGAVVTPSVRDELKTRRIELVRGAAAVPALESQTRVVLAVIGPAGDPQHLVDALASRVERVERFPAGDLLSAVRGLAEQITSRDVLGVLLTDEPVAAVCLANRIHGVRAAWAVDRRGVQQALDGIGANLLVVTLPQHGAADTRELVEHFVSAGSPLCPSPFLAMLEQVR